jgi:hypothetical protein
MAAGTVTAAQSRTMIGSSIVPMHTFQACHKQDMECLDELYPDSPEGRFIKLCHKFAAEPEWADRLNPLELIDVRCFSVESIMIG